MSGKPAGHEAYRSVAAEMYEPGETGYRKPGEVLADLEPSVVEEAKSYAKRAHKRWPPRPECDVPMLRTF